MGDFEHTIDLENDPPLYDSQDRPVNRNGYITTLDPHNPLILNKYNFNPMFTPDELEPETGDIPMPYRLECYNFNPHEIIGDFDYDQLSLKPIILKSRKTGMLVDKNLRRVNQYGYLIDDEGNVVDNEGRRRMPKAWLRENGDFPLMLNYEGKSFDIKTIIGIFDKDHLTKKIILQENAKKGLLLDKFGRRVNLSGYLVDH